MRNVLVVVAALFFASNACADNLTPTGSTLYLERGTSPDRLMQEVDPNYDFHAKAAKKRLKRSLYFLLMSLNEYKLYQNHLRTLSLEVGDKNKGAVLTAIRLLEGELHPRVEHSPLAHVMSTVPEVSMSIGPASRIVHVAEPVPFSSREARLYDGLASPSVRAQGKRPVVNDSYRTDLPLLSPSPSPQSLSSFKIPQLDSGIKSRVAEECSTCPPPPDYNFAK